MKNYKVTLWSGSGYWLNEPVHVKAHDDEEALVLASIEDKHAFCINANEADDDMEEADNYIYLDRSEYGKDNIYLLIENAMVELE